jgi:hypothetical protein
LGVCKEVKNSRRYPSHMYATLYESILFTKLL